MTGVQTCALPIYHRAAGLDGVDARLCRRGRRGVADAGLSPCETGQAQDACGDHGNDDESGAMRHGPILAQPAANGNGARRFSPRTHRLTTKRRVLRKPHVWSDGRVAEGAGLLNLCTGNCTEGSNPSRSASAMRMVRGEM